MSPYLLLLLLAVNNVASIAVPQQTDKVEEVEVVTEVSVQDEGTDVTTEGSQLRQDDDVTIPPKQEVYTFRDGLQELLDEDVTTHSSDILDDGFDTATETRIQTEDPDKGFYFPDSSFVPREEPEDFPDLTRMAEAPEPIEIEPGMKISNVNVTDSDVFEGRAGCMCGRSPRRIVGGSAANIAEFPWTAALVRTSGLFGQGRAYCGGTLINNLYVLTASHCVDGMSARGIQVVLNQEDFSGPSSNHKYGVSKIIMHPSYNRRTIDYDIALLRLSQGVNIGSGAITPACLPASNDNDFNGVQATVVGWGATSQGGTTSSRIRKVDVPIMTNSACNKDTKYNGKITENMMCAGYLEGGKDSCQGDSGGPLVIPNGGRKTLVGVVSWGYGCAQAQSPGVYTRVARFPDWILKNTRDADWCQN